MMRYLMTCFMVLTISQGFACKPYNGGTSSNLSTQPEVRVCQASDGNACLTYQSAAYTKDSLKLSTPAESQGALWFLFENGDYLTLQPKQEASQSIVLQKMGTDLQQTRLLNPVTQKYLQLQDGNVAWTDEAEQGTEFSFHFVPKADQTNSLR